MPLLREREGDEHLANFRILVIVEPFDTDVIEICHSESLWRSAPN